MKEKKKSINAIEKRLNQLEDENSSLRQQMGFLIKSILSSDTLVKTIINDHNQILIDMSVIAGLLQNMSVEHQKSHEDFRFESSDLFVTPFNSGSCSLN